MKCIRCQTENLDTALCCSKCGASMPTLPAEQKAGVLDNEWMRKKTNSLLLMGLMMAILGLIMEIGAIADELGAGSYARTSALVCWFLGLLIVGATLMDY